MQANTGRETAECLSRTMRRAGHTLDWRCGLCPHNCSYALPCGCLSAHCADHAASAYPIKARGLALLL